MQSATFFYNIFIRLKPALPSLLQQHFCLEEETQFLVWHNLSV
jgi:hypothetical protein